MAAKLILDKNRIALHKQSGEVEIRPGKAHLSQDEVAELMAELREDDDASGQEQGD